MQLKDIFSTEINSLNVGEVTFRLHETISSSDLGQRQEHSFLIRVGTSLCKDFHVIISGGDKQATLSIVDNANHISSVGGIILGYFSKDLYRYISIDISANILDIEEFVKNYIINYDVSEGDDLNNFLCLKRKVLRPKLYGDGIHDDTEALQYIIDNERTFCVPKGTYKISDTLDIWMDCDLYETTNQLKL